MMISLWKSLPEGDHQRFFFHDIIDFCEGPQEQHIHHSNIFKLVSGLVDRRNWIYIDVLPSGRIFDVCAFPDEETAFFDAGFEFAERRLIEHNSHIIFANDRGGDRLVADVYDAVCCAASHFGPIGRHPADLFSFLHGCIGQGWPQGWPVARQTPRQQ